MNKQVIKDIIKDMIANGEMQVTLNIPEYFNDHDHSVENGHDVKSVIGDCTVELEVEECVNI